MQKEVSLRPRNPTARYSVPAHDLIMRVKQLGVGKRRSRPSIASLTAEEIRFDGCLDSSNCRPVENAGERRGVRQAGFWWWYFWYHVNALVTPDGRRQAAVVFRGCGSKRRRDIDRSLESA